MKSLQERLRDLPQVGRIEWIGVRPAHGEPMIELADVFALESRGLTGDVAAQGKAGGNRQVTLVQAEHLAVIAGLARSTSVAPDTLRRNLVVSGINLIALARLRFRIGNDVVLHGTGACAPCSKMDLSLGPGGFQAMRGHGGITARIERGGQLRIGDSVEVLIAVESCDDPR
jgi:MOSC domain-containing protein YiiM